MISRCEYDDYGSGAPDAITLRVASYVAMLLLVGPLLVLLFATIVLDAPGAWGGVRWVFWGAVGLMLFAEVLPRSIWRRCDLPLILLRPLVGLGAQRGKHLREALVAGPLLAFFCVDESLVAGEAFNAWLRNIPAAVGVVFIASEAFFAANRRRSNPSRR